MKTTKDILDYVERELKPEYMNDVFSWRRIIEAITKATENQIDVKSYIEEERNYCKTLLDAGFQDSQSEDRCYAKFEFCNTILNKLIDNPKP